jgi:hypothetical protein
MKILKMILIVCMLSTTINSQTSINYNVLSKSGGSIGTIDATLSSNSEVLGSPFLYKDWNNFAIMYLNNGNVFKTKNINFNIEKSNFSFKISKDSIFIFDNIDKIEFTEQNFININNKFYESLVTRKEGNLLKEYTVKIEPKLHIITSTVIGPGKYKKGSKYFYYENGKLNEIKLRKKDIIEVLNLKKDKVLKYVKSQNLSYTNEKDVIEIFKFYDTL